MEPDRDDEDDNQEEDDEEEEDLGYAADYDVEVGDVKVQAGSSSCGEIPFQDLSGIFSITLLQVNNQGLWDMRL